MNYTYRQNLNTESDLKPLSGALARAIQNGVNIYLQGELGAGKTSFVRAFLHALGYEGKVKSPTYTLVEPYHVNTHLIYHFDLYRIHESQELIDIGISDYFAPPAICFVEWPAKGSSILPLPDLDCYIDILKSEEGSSGRRQFTIAAKTSRGEEMLSQMKNYLGST